MKVVINDCSGLFSISLDAARFMAKRGNVRARAEVDKYDAKKYGRTELSAFDAHFGVTFFGYGHIEGMQGGYERSDKDLVAAVENLGKKANGRRASLKVIEIPDGIEWEIVEYNGNEHVAQKHRIWY